MAQEHGQRVHLLDSPAAANTSLQDGAQRGSADGCTPVSRSDGSTQATYGGHPLYTYVADTGPGQANGNNLNLKGGLWHEVTVT